MVVTNFEQNRSCRLFCKKRNTNDFLYKKFSEPVKPSVSKESRRPSPGEKRGPLRGEGL